MLVTGAKKPDNTQSALLRLAIQGLSGGTLSGLSLHKAKLAKNKFSNKLYMKDIKAQISDHYKSRQ